MTGVFVCLFCRPDLIFDKNGIKVTSSPPGDENGVIELRVESEMSGQMILIIENTGDETVILKHITLMWSVNFFDYSEIRRIGDYKSNLQPGKFISYLLGAFYSFRQSPSNNYLSESSRT